VLCTHGGPLEAEQAKHAVAGGRYCDIPPLSKDS
jgi:hypothetical protein